MSGYRLEDELGRGALGRVLRVRAADGRVLAGKLLHRSHEGDPRARARLDAEASLMAGISHANLVGVHGLVEIDGERVLLMDLVEGGDLATTIARETTLPVHRAVRLARGIAAGLAEAHRHGVVHRDLKPANVLVAPGDVPRIVDFGLARAAALTGVAAGDLVVVGTPAYMAPEAVDPLAVDARSDLYALGCILFEMLSGAPPFTGPTSLATLELHRDAPRPPLPPDVPASLASLIHALLAPSPADRPPSALAVERALAESHALARGLTATSACSRCGRPLVPGVPVCFACAAPQLSLADGQHTVFVTGPGELTHKLDAGLRARLLDFLAARPSLGLAATRLGKEAPRLPFVLVAGVDEASAGELVASLATIGLTAVVVRGGRFALGDMRRKGLRMSWRYFAMGAFGVWQLSHLLGLWTVPTAIAGLATASAHAFHTSSRPVCDRSVAETLALPAPLAASLARIAPVVQVLGEERHRDALRGVVARALAVAEAVPAEEAARIGEDLARVVDLALVAASRLDELERGVDPARLAGGDPALRERLRERDRLAAQLLDLTAQLDALRARWAAARAGDDTTLDELRAQLDALDELKALR